EPPEDFYSLEISLYRVPYEEHDEQEALISHEVFLSALVSAAVELEEVDVTANVQQYYSAENTKWRISLLANPPEFGEFDSELGTVSVAGVGLRFSDSQVGLLSAALDISPFGDEYRCALTFFHTVRLEQIDALF